MPDLRYRTGTCSVTADGEVVTFSSAYLLTHAMIGDHISINRLPSVEVVSVDGDLTLGIEPWNGDTLTGVPYVLFQDSLLRATRGQTAVDNARLNAAFTSIGYIYYVKPGEEPDPSDGYEGQTALDVSTGLKWIKTDGVWEAAGIVTLPEDYSITVPGTGAVYGKQIDATDNIAVTSSFYDSAGHYTPEGWHNVSALRVNYTQQGPLATGARFAGNFNFFFDGPTAASNAARFYAAICNTTQINVDDNGTAMAPAGLAYGSASIIHLDPAVKHWYGVIGHEVDMHLYAGSSVELKWAFTAVSSTDDAVHGSQIEAAYHIQKVAGAVGWKNGLLASNFDGSGSAMTADSNLVATQGDVTLGNVIDVESATVAGYLLKSGPLKITGQGAIDLVTGDLTGDIPASFLKSGSLTRHIYTMLGRTDATGTDLVHGVAGETNGFVTGSVAGDAIVSFAGANLHFGRLGATALARLGADFTLTVPFVLTPGAVAGDGPAAKILSGHLARHVYAKMGRTDATSTDLVIGISGATNDFSTGSAAGDATIVFDGTLHLGHLGAAALLKIATGAITSTVPIVLPANPASALHAAPKQYVDAVVAALGTASTKNTGVLAGQVPILGTGGFLDPSTIPAYAITDTFVVASQAAMLALSTADKGDIAVRTDLNKSFILSTSSYSTLADWKELLTPTDAVLSVAGLTGGITAAALRSALALVIGTDVVAFSHVGAGGAAHANAVAAGAAGFMTGTDKTKLDGVASGATANSADAALVARANHTGTQSADTLSDGTSNKAFLAAERTKLAGIATGATANSADAALLARANHTGTQSGTTIDTTGLTAAAAVADADTLMVNQGAANLKQTFTAIKTWIKSWIAKADVGLSNAENTSDANKPLSTAQAAAMRGHLSGLTLSAAGGSAIFNIASGNAIDSTAVAAIALSSAYTKSASAWAVGSGNGALDVGTIEASKGYFAYGIKRVDTGVSDVLVSLAPAASATVTISNASPGVATWIDHGLQVNAPIVFTNSGGALPTGLTAGTQYFLKTVLSADTFTVSATQGGAAINTSSAGSGAHTGTSNPILPANYILSRRIGAMTTDGSSQWVAFIQRGREFFLSVPIADYSAVANPGTAAILRALSVPTGIPVMAIIHARSSTVTASSAVATIFTDPAQADTTPDFTLAQQIGNTSLSPFAQLRIGTNRSRQIRARLSFSDASVGFTCVTDGWVDYTL